MIEKTREKCCLEIVSEHTSPAGMLMSEVFTCFMKGISMGKKTDKEIERVENSQNMSLKLARVWVVDPNTMKEFLGLWMLLEESAIKRN